MWMMIDRIRDLCRQNNTNFSAIEKQLGFANGSLSKTDEKTQNGRIKALADFFNVTTDYLISGSLKQIYQDKPLRDLVAAAEGCAEEDIEIAISTLRRLKAYRQAIKEL